MLSNPDTGFEDPEWLYLRWAALFGAALQGFWVVTSVYIVIDVGLGPVQLLLLGTTLEATILVAEVPTGVVADTISRRLSMIISMVLVGAALIAIGFATSFPMLVAANALWGIGFTFSSGADVAWFTDEMLHRGSDQPSIDVAFARAARWRQRGGAAGLVFFGLLGWLTSLTAAIWSAGVLVLFLGLAIAMWFPENGFNAVRVDRLGESARILRSGLTLVRGDRMVMRLLAVTLLFNLGAEAMDRLTELRLINLGLPRATSPVVFFTALGIVGLLAGAAMLKLIESRLDGENGPRLIYGAMSLLAALGAAVVAGAPLATVAAVGVFLTRGLAWSVIPVVSSIWINRTTTSEARATVQSVLGQAESAGQLAGGLLLGAVAGLVGLAAALATAAILFAICGLLILRR
ncbi:MAG: MFS transporter [Acidimicrobiales bacterium]